MTFKMIVASALAAFAVMAQEQFTPEELSLDGQLTQMVGLHWIARAEYFSDLSARLYKAPLERELNPGGPEENKSYEPRSIVIVDADARPRSPEVAMLPAVSPNPAMSDPLKVHTANWQPISQPPILTQCPGVCASYSGQGAAALEAVTGKRVKGVQLVAAEVCSTRLQTFGAGLILQTANKLGIQTHAPKIGSAIVSHTLSLDWRAITINTVKVGTMLAASLTVPGVIAASRAISTGLVVAHAAADSLPLLLSPGAPNPDPYLSSVVDPNGTITVSPDRCVEVTFSGVYGKNAVVLSGPVQILP